MTQAENIPPQHSPAPYAPAQQGAPAPRGAPGALAAQGAPGPQDAGRSELRRRRDALAEQVTELHWDLGGLAYEMAIRDHFRLDVLVRRAAVLQERDAELAEVERLLRLEESASAGNCPHCAAPHSRGALYCWQCGATLMERAPAAHAATDGADGPAEAIQATTERAGDSASALQATDGARESTAALEALLVPSAASQSESSRAVGTPTE